MYLFLNFIENQLIYNKWEKYGKIYACIVIYKNNWRFYELFRVANQTVRWGKKIQWPKDKDLCTLYRQKRLEHYTINRVLFPLSRIRLKFYKHLLNQIFKNLWLFFSQDSKLYTIITLFRKKSYCFVI